MTGAALPGALGNVLQRMVGFRNVAVHDYRALSLEIVRGIIENRTVDLRTYVEWALMALRRGNPEPMSPR